MRGVDDLIVRLKAEGQKEEEIKVDFGDVAEFVGGFFESEHRRAVIFCRAGGFGDLHFVGGGPAF